jgi:hypothetical protein
MLSLSAIKLADGSSVDVEPAVTVRCDFAMALADWTRDEIAPALAAMGKLTKLTGAGGYECRTRNRVPGAKMSEHATGNAFDVHGFVFANGKRMSVIDLRANLETLASMRAATCQRFMTVLGPGADSAHADHLHVDLEFRRGGRHLCQWPDTAPTPAESVTR